MKSKASLTLMEQSTMLLVFALAAALCLKGFLWAQQTARENIDRDQAVICAQNAAERIKHTGLKDEWTIYYNENWQPAEQAAAFQLTALPTALGKAQITVKTGAGEPIFSIPVAWQEVYTP